MAESNLKLSPLRVLGLLGLAFCAFVAYQVEVAGPEEKAQAEAARLVAAQAAAKQKRVMVGMTQDEAIQAWGRPDKVNATTSANLIEEQWVYRKTDACLYFKNGRLTTIQN